MKLGIDVHGVITYKPEFFSALAKLFRSNGHEVHIITGSMVNDAFIEELKSLGMEWDHIFSISTYHIEKGDIEITYDDKGTPWMLGGIWDKTKADYCSQEGIDFHIDDSDVYGIYFETPYCNFSNDEFIWHLKGRNPLGGRFSLDDVEKIYNKIIEVHWECCAA